VTERPQAAPMRAAGGGMGGYDRFPTKSALAGEMVQGDSPGGLASGRPRRPSIPGTGYRC
jgi:hypothetical protein